MPIVLSGSYCPEQIYGKMFTIFRTRCGSYFKVCEYHSVLNFLRCCYAGIAHIPEDYHLLCDHSINKSKMQTCLVITLCKVFLSFHSVDESV